MRQAFEEIADALRAGGVDFFLIETMSDVSEMALAVEACRAVAEELPVVVSMSFEPAKDGFRTNMGVTVEDATHAMAQSGADAVGTNCGALSPRQINDVVRIIAKNTDKPILAQPNAGLPIVEGERVVYRLSPVDFARAAMEIVDTGARLVGGCCGTGPEHIKTLNESLDRGRV